MSRYHPVRTKQNKQHHQVPQPAAPAQSPMPTEAQMEQMARGRLQAAFEEIYKLRNGAALDASIARWTKMLELYDREQAALEKEDGSKQHRWTVSPSIAFRTDKHLHELLERREKLQAECWAEAKNIVRQFIQDYGPGNSSLCPPKQTEPAPKGNPQPTQTEGATAEPDPIAA
jgi:hypothetical protein